MRKSVTVSAILLLFLLFSLMPFVGCGVKEAEKEGEPAVEEEAAEEEMEVMEVPAAEEAEEEEEGPEIVPEEEAAEEPPAGYLYERQEIGSTTPLEYLQLVNVDWSSHGDYFRVVAELKRLDGTDTTRVPWCFADYSEDPSIEYGKEIRLYIRGVRPEDIHVPGLRSGEGMPTGDPECHQLLMTSFGSVDGVELVNIFVSTREQRPFRLTYATAPLRIILDIWKGGI